MNNNKMKQHTNKILLIVLLVLLSAFVLTKVFRSPARESNLDADAFSIDTAQISSIKFHLSGNPKSELTLKKSDSVWTIQQDEKTAAVESYQLNNLLRTLSKLKPERIVSRNKEKWNSYEVDDTTAVHMVAYTKGMDELANWYIGKESQGLTYIRPADGESVYALEGSLRNNFDRTFAEWRDKTFLRVKKAFINKINFQYPADSGFVLEKKDGTWMIDNKRTDSVKVENYFRQLQAKDLTSFADDFAPKNDPDITISFEGNNQSSATVKAWKSSDDKWILTSDLQDNVYFYDTSFAADLFIGKKQLTGQ